MFDCSKIKNSYGLLYHDPNGCINEKMLSNFFRKNETKHLDCLINCSATAIKRNYFSNKSLLIRLKEINKERWLIRKPIGRWQWTFIIGTNWNAFPDLKKLGFYYLDSEEGQLIFSRLNEIQSKKYEKVNETWKQQIFF